MHINVSWSRAPPSAVCTSIAIWQKMHTGLMTFDPGPKGLILVHLGRLPRNMSILSCIDIQQQYTWVPATDWMEPAWAWGDLDPAP